VLLVYDLLLYSPEVCLMDFVGTVLNSCLCSVAQWRRDLTDLSLLSTKPNYLWLENFLDSFLS